MLTVEEARSRVAKGAEILDAIQPGWFARINIETLAVESYCRCVLAQSMDMNYGAAAARLGIDIELTSRRKLSVVPLGLHYEGDDDYGIPMLQEAWIEAIADRLFPQAQATSATPDAVDPVASAIGMRVRRA